MKIVKDDHFDRMFEELQKDPEYLSELRRIEEQEKRLSNSKRRNEQSENMR